MKVEIGSQVEIETDTDGYAVVEVTAGPLSSDGADFIGSRVYTPGDVRFNEEDINEVFEY